MELLRALRPTHIYFVSAYSSVAVSLSKSCSVTAHPNFVGSAIMLLEVKASLAEKMETYSTLNGAHHLTFCVYTPKGAPLWGLVRSGYEVR